MDSGKILFTELPYACALLECYRKTVCATCFRSEVDPVASRCCCASVAYCSQSCRASDSRMHQYECAAEQQTNRNGFDGRRTLFDKNLLHLARFLGRLLARQRVDNGRATLSEGFPTHLGVADRRLSDLRSHRWAFRLRGGWLLKNARLVRRTFFDYFANTELAGVRKRTVLRWFFVLRINCFDIYRSHAAPVLYDPTLDPGTNTDLTFDLGRTGKLGAGLYLNASRFDHSCRPTLGNWFDGCRMIVRTIDDRSDHDDDVDDRSTMIAERLSSLTFKYGFAYGCSLLATPERRQWLQKRYFFRCRCELCSDKIGQDTQVNSSSTECPNCDRPYLWRLHFGRCFLKRDCVCSNAPAVVRIDRSTEKSYRRLRKECRAILRESINYSRLARDQCRLQKQIRTAEICWHPTKNLRLGQLYERLFLNGYLSISHRPNCGHSIDSWIRYGESMMIIYQNYAEEHAVDLNQLAALLAEMQLRAGDRDRYLHWVTFADRLGHLDTRSRRFLDVSISEQSKSSVQQQKTQSQALGRIVYAN